MSTSTLRKPLVGIAIATAVLLLVPAVSMQLTSEVSWGPGDFIIAGILLFSAGVATVIARRHVTGTRRRVAVIFAIAVALALVWAELAVGLLH